MALQSATTIYIGSNPINAFKTFTLNQNISAHHVLNLECRIDVLEDQNEDFLNTAKKYLGEILTLQVTSLAQFENYKRLDFKGVVTAVSNKRGKNGEHIMLIKAESPTVICDAGWHFNSFQDKSLNTILSDVFQNVDTSKLSTSFNPDFTDVITYSVQQKESSWSYAKRLAMQYGEWLFYDGKKLIFGSPESGDDVVLKYGFDLQGYSIDLMPLPNSFHYASKDYLNNEVYASQSSENTTEASGYHGFVNDCSRNLYTEEAEVWVNGFSGDEHQQRLNDQEEQQKRVVEARQVFLKGNSDNPGVSLGKIIEITDNAGSRGRYRIIKVSHSNFENGQYNNIFEGISADIDKCPLNNPEATPKSHSQTAVVVENADPEGLSRVKVQFPWQIRNNESTPWIRVLTPHAGNEKGFHFIPEIDEEVLVGFENSNAEHPYVLGNLYNGKQKVEDWQSDTNAIKAIRTRSGHTIELNDEDGEEKINIYDNAGSIITFDTQAKSLYITTAENLEFQAKNIKMTAEENIQLEAKNNLSLVSEGDTQIASQGLLNFQSDNDLTLKSTANIKVESEANMEVQAQSIRAEGQVSTEIKGQQTKIQGQITALEGASGKIEII
ncbi:type VI secretion system Vgr family protein [Pseudotamlana agarivorans]|uniref:type VI secretion system Vgr family protein n=1 Tax=Pseudotamlana agarivorans TaxID=481183 RepID=UPI000831B3EB|nr:phage baseplate assembly protein V [Tamlana agarivorans]